MKTFLIGFAALLVAGCAIAQTVYSVKAGSSVRTNSPSNVSTNRGDYETQYKLGAESMPQEGVPRGELIKMPPFTNSAIYPATVRDWWVYVPKQYNGSKPACLMVFQDGGAYSSSNGQYRVPVVFDNLIAKKEMPVTIGVFVNPGNIPAAGAGQRARSNRSFEYDSLGDQYARFLLTEILPEVAKKYNITKDPEGRAIGGASSGAICAWTWRGNGRTN